MLVGRDRELRELTQALDRAEAGHGDVLVLTGPRGAGTTALADAAVELARERRLPVLRGGGRLMWTQLARDRGVPDDVVAPLLASPGPLELDDVARRLVSAEPLLIVVDDVDRCDGVELLTLLAGRLGASRTLVVTTARVPVGVGREVPVRGLSLDELALLLPSSSQALWVASRGLPGIALELAAFGDSLVDIALNALSSNEFLDVDPPLIRLLELGVSRATGLDRAHLLARLARELVGDASSHDRRRELIAEAVRLAPADPEVLDARLFALWEPLAAQDRIDTGRRIAALAQSDSLARKGLFWQFVGLMELGQVAAAESVLGLFHRAAETAGDGPDIVMALSRQAMLATLRGRFDDVSRLVSEFAPLGIRYGVPDTQRLAGTVLGVVAAELGDHARLSEGATALSAGARRFPGHFFEATAAGLLVLLGRLDEAAAELHRLLPAVLSGTGPRWIAAMADLSAAAVSVSDVDAASSLYPALLPLSDRLVVWAGANTVREPVSYWLGRLALVLGRSSDAASHLRHAVALATEIGALPILSRAQAALDALEVPATNEWRLARDGSDWLLTAGPESARLRDSRGLHYLRALISVPGKEVPALDLAADGTGLASPSTTPLLDDTALRAYRSRLSELDEDDPERTFVLDELRRATGLGGRSRAASAEAERARVNVTRTLRTALDRIAAQAPLAAAHLQASVRTGLACRYDPAPGGPSRWRV